MRDRDLSSAESESANVFQAHWAKSPTGHAGVRPFLPRNTQNLEYRLLRKDTRSKPRLELVWLIVIVSFVWSHSTP